MTKKMEKKTVEGKRKLVAVVAPHSENRKLWGGNEWWDSRTRGVQDGGTGRRFDSGKHWKRRKYREGGKRDRRRGKERILSRLHIHPQHRAQRGA